MTEIESDAFVFFGATGDLAYKKIFPALCALSRSGRLHVPVIGVGRSAWTIEQFRAYAEKSVREHGAFDALAFARFAERLAYVQGDYHDAATFASLEQLLGDARRPLYYLAIPPSMFATVVGQLGRFGCTRGARVIVEKPFGRDLSSARALNQTLHDVFPESSVFRIDHYLGKEAVQNLIVMRFANTFLEPIWNRNYVQRVQITMAEQFGVEGRGRFYEEAGAVRDVVQNHLLQVVGILAMEPPATTYQESIRDELVKVFRQINALEPAQLVRGQFTGYRRETGVAEDSQVETFAALRLEVDSWRWNGVPFFVRAGKCLPVTATEVLVELKRPPVKKLACDPSNYLRLRLGPQVSIAMGLRVKRPGDTMESVPSELTLLHRPSAAELGPYERLLGDALLGDATLFARQDAVEEQWRIVQPILGEGTPLYEYAPGSWGPREAERLARDVGGWAPVAE